MFRRRAPGHLHPSCADRGCALCMTTVETRQQELEIRADLERRLQGAKDESEYRLGLLQTARAEVAAVRSALEFARTDAGELVPLAELVQERENARRAERMEVRWRDHYEAAQRARELAERTLLERRHQSVRRIITGPVVDRIGLAEDLVRSSAGEMSLAMVPVHAIGGGLLSVSQLADLLRVVGDFAPRPQPRVDGAQ